MMVDTTLDPEFVASLARGGFAEQLTPEQRRSIHLETPLDNYLRRALEDGKQVVLTGNPGDGKTQHILKLEEDFPPENYFYISDASEFEDNEKLVQKWDEAFQEGAPGALAMNDGPLFEVVSSHKDEYEFLQIVDEQVRNQVVYGDHVPLSNDAFSQIVVLDLDNRDILTPRIIPKALEILTADDLTADEYHDHEGVCHIEYNTEKLRDRGIRDEIQNLLVYGVRTAGEHITIRDLLNFLSHLITGGQSRCEVDPPTEYRYYNLAYSGEGKIFDILRSELNPERLTHPFADAEIWASVREDLIPEERDEENLRERYRQEKRRSLFEPKDHLSSFRPKDLYHDKSEEWHNRRNGGETDRVKAQIIKELNRYFDPGIETKHALRLWVSHNFRSKDSIVYVSQCELEAHRFDFQIPKLHPEIAEAMAYTPDVIRFALRDSDEDVGLAIPRDFMGTYGEGTRFVPQFSRDRDQETALLRFMEEAEYSEGLQATDEKQISIRMVEENTTEQVTVRDGNYILSRGHG